MKKVMTGLIALVFVASCFLIMTSCASQQTTQGTTGEQASAQQAPGKEGAPAGGFAKEEDMSPAQVNEMTRALATFNTEKIYFAFDRSDLTDASKAVLKEKADFLNTYKFYNVQIAGHCDERGTNDYNLALGERRANAAMKYLMALGIAEGRIDTISYGEERPANPGHNEAAWAENRRDEFVAER